MTEATKIDIGMVLAAGLGTRMRPITNTIPKPLVSVAGKTLLDRALDNLSAGGVERVYVNVHYLPELIEEHLRSRSVPEVRISDEREHLLDSGGGVKNAIAAEADAPMFILNGDTFWIDAGVSSIERLKSVWNSEQMDMLLLVACKDHAVGYDDVGDFFMDDQGHLTRRGEAQEAPYVYAGAIVTRTSQINSVSDVKFSLNQLFDEAIARNRLYGCLLDGLWLHVGTPASIDEAEQAIERYAARHG